MRMNVVVEVEEDADVLSQQRQPKRGQFFCLRPRVPLASALFQPLLPLGRLDQTKFIFFF